MPGIFIRMTHGTGENTHSLLLYRQNGLHTQNARICNDRIPSPLAVNTPHLQNDLVPDQLKELLRMRSTEMDFMSVSICCSQKKDGSLRTHCRSSDDQGFLLLIGSILSTLTTCLFHL